MQDDKYCYPDSRILKNKLNIHDQSHLFEAEKDLTFIRLRELQINPIKGNFDFEHLKAIHKYIFQDIYDWAGKERIVEIGKGNIFCLTAYIQEYAKSVFNKYFSQCYSVKNNYKDFIRIFAENYGDLNALHPFREGNGRTQREFARLVCTECGYNFNLSVVTHSEMLNASVLSFNKADNSEFIKIFSKAVTPLNETVSQNLDSDLINVLTKDDLIIKPSDDYNYYETDCNKVKQYDSIYQSRISIMNAKKIISDAENQLTSEDNSD